MTILEDATIHRLIIETVKGPIERGEGTSPQDWIKFARTIEELTIAALQRARTLTVTDAQPSPGGQGDAQTIEKLRAMMDHSFGGPGFVVYGTAQSIAEVERRLAPGIAARQPGVK